MTVDDLDQVGALWQLCFRGATQPPSEGLLRYFREVLLEHPWFSKDLAPLILERKGEVIGFMGRMGRPMTFRNEPVRCAVATQLMVHPDFRGGYSAIELVRAFQHGPQDLCYSDGANEASLRIWERCGGTASRLLSFEWTRRLRPAQSFAVSLREHRAFSIVARVMHPCSGAFDALAVRMLPRFYHKPKGELIRQEATPAQLLPLLQQVQASAILHADYTPVTFSWLLRKAGEAKGYGPLRCIMVLDADKQPIGWFAYYGRPGETAYVLQVISTYGNATHVLAELFREAWERDASSVHGQIDPQLMTEMSNSYCHFRCTHLGVLLHSSNPEILNTIQRGDAMIGRLDGEWWLRFGIDRHTGW